MTCTCKDRSPSSFDILAASLLYSSALAGNPWKMANFASSRRQPVLELRTARLSSPASDRPYSHISIAFAKFALFSYQIERCRQTSTTVKINYMSFSCKVFKQCVDLVQKYFRQPRSMPSPLNPLSPCLFDCLQAKTVQGSSFLSTLDFLIRIWHADSRGGVRMNLD